MSATPTNVVHMPKMIQVRNVPDDVHRALKASALAEGMSLSDFIKRELAAIATQASFEEIDARIRDAGLPGCVRRPSSRRCANHVVTDAGGRCVRPPEYLGDAEEGRGGAPAADRRPRRLWAPIWLTPRSDMPCAVAFVSVRSPPMLSPAHSTT